MARYNGDIEVEHKTKRYFVDFICNVFKDELYNDWFYDVEVLNIKLINSDLTTSDTKITKELKNLCTHKVIMFVEKLHEGRQYESMY